MSVGSHRALNARGLADVACSVASFLVRTTLVVGLAGQGSLERTAGQRQTKLGWGVAGLMAFGCLRQQQPTTSVRAVYRVTGR